MKTFKLQPEPLTREAFEPYGFVIGGTGQGAPDFVNDAGTTGWRVNLEIARPLYMILRTPRLDMRIGLLERHFNVTQTFLPLGGGLAALAVARSGATGLPPAQADVRLFLLDGTVGYALHPGTWHGLDRVPLTDQGTTWLMITDADTQADLAKVPHGAAQHTENLDLPGAWGTVIEIDA